MVTKKNFSPNLKTQNIWSFEAMLFQVVLSMCALGQKKVSGNWLDKKNFITYPPA